MTSWIDGRCVKCGKVGRVLSKRNLCYKCQTIANLSNPETNKPASYEEIPHITDRATLNKQYHGQDL